MNYIEYLEGLFWLFDIKFEDNKYVSDRVTFEREKLEIADIESLENLYEKTQDIIFDECEIMYKQDEKNFLEVVISDDVLPLSFYLRREREPNFKLLKDETNDLEYKISEPSSLYLVWYLKRIFQELGYASGKKTAELRALKRRFFDRFRGRRLETRDSNDNQVSIIDILKRIFRFYTLLIIQSENSSIDLKKALTSYSYTYMRNLQIPFKVYKFQDTLPILNRETKNIDDIEFEAPKRLYNSDLVDYYQLAVSSLDPFVEFISYYHIIEYLYDDVFREHQINSLKQAITAPTFSYKDDDKVFSVIQTILKDNKLVRENGSGNEQQSLNYVLNKYITDIDAFKNRFTEDELNYYRQNTAKFSKGNQIDWDKEYKKVINAISTRIYKNRNSLIHSKSSKKDETYHPYKDREELKKEIPLIKSIAETIIEINSEYL